MVVVLEDPPGRAKKILGIMNMRTAQENEIRRDRRSCGHSPLPKFRVPQV
jgi:hypothetical protein